MMNTTVAMAVLAVVLMAVAGRTEGQSPSSSSRTCIDKLIPCASYLSGSAKPPTSTCCAPLQQAFKTELDCLCAVFNDRNFLKTFNVTTEEATNLAKACGVADDSCSAAAPSDAAADASAPASPAAEATTSTAPSGTHEGHEGEKKSDGYKANLMGVSGLISFFLLWWSILA